jgi:hypothetical protein
MAPFFAVCGDAPTTARDRGEKARMPLSAVDSITVVTDMFEHRNAKPHFINPCCFGEDFAEWLKQELSHFEGPDFNFSEMTQEDYGWGFWASHGGDRFWLAVSYVGDGPQQAPAQWVISVSYDPGLNLVKRVLNKPDRPAFGLLRDRVRQILTSNDAIKTNDDSNL